MSFMFQSLFSWNLLLMVNIAARRRFDGDGFQSLFSWNLLLMGHRHETLAPHTGVSILVFVELALDAKRYCASPLVFNGVSILVFVELALDVYSVNLSGIVSMCFNPCFRGTCSWWGMATERGSRITSGFNPCFRGTCSWCSPTGDGGHPGTCFNPCFRGTCSWWSCLPSGFRPPSQCFNPCFRGTCSWWTIIGPLKDL